MANLKRKRQLKKAIEDLEREIEALELKRERSQNAVMRALLSGTEASPEDKEYFMMFSTLIENERVNLRQLYAELAELEKKK